jgi:hypothetical protein
LKSPKTDWSTGKIGTVNTAISRLHSLTGSDLIQRDPVFGSPVKFVLVDQIYGGSIENAVGLNSFASSYYQYWISGNKFTDAHAARLIQIKDWDNSKSSDREEAISTRGLTIIGTESRVKPFVLVFLQPSSRPAPCDCAFC